jgi:hypothetical protein
MVTIVRECRPRGYPLGWVFGNVSRVMKHPPVRNTKNAHIWGATYRPGWMFARCVSP